ncbi:hypothetical protein C8R43DRAFT_1233497 [Mycena crocata]|nr:hypothetical protein C8R43DRAFT_1233497 [Mycena crocata]
MIRGPQGAKGLFAGNSKLPSAKVIQRVYNIDRTTPGAIATCGVLAIWLLSSDTQIVSDGDETKIDYKFLFQSFLRQICEGLRDEADWAIGLFHHWDTLLFPNTEHSHGQIASANRQAVSADVDAMDAAFRAAAPPRASSADPSSPLPDPAPSQASTSSRRESSPRTPAPATHGRRRTTRPSRR